MSIMGGITAQGFYKPFLVDIDGRLQTSGGGGGGGGGAGDASEATLQAIRDRLPVNLVGGRLAVTVDDPIDVNLPTGAATESTLATLSGKIPALGQATKSASLPVVLASNSDPLPVTLSGDVSTETTLAALSNKFSSLGQKTAAASVPVVLASNQSTLPVSIQNTPTVSIDVTTLPLPVGITNFPAFNISRIVDATGNAFSSTNRLPVEIAVPVNISGAIDTELPTAAALGDAEALATTVPSVGSRQMLFNGATWDRQRSGLTGLVSTTGMANCIPVGLFLTSPPTLTDNQAHNLLVSSSGRLLVDTAATATTALADADANPSTSRQGANLLGYHEGTGTWDRLRAGSTTIDTTPRGYLNTLGVGIGKTTLPTVGNDEVHPLILTNTGALVTGSQATRTTIAQFSSTYNLFNFSLPLTVDAHDVSVLIIGSSVADIMGEMYLQVANDTTGAGATQWVTIASKVIRQLGQLWVVLPGYTARIQVIFRQLQSGSSFAIDTYVSYGD